MGIIRLLLASIILSKHSHNILGHYLINPVFAVEIFFLISGFIVQKMLMDYSVNFSLSKFYLSRFIKIYPAYYLAFIITFLIFIFSTVINGSLHKIFNEVIKAQSYFEGINLIIINFFILVSNLFIFLQDFTIILKSNLGDIKFDFAHSYSEIDFSNLIIVPLAWSLAIELYFYLLAPFLLKLRTINIIAIAIIFLVLKIYGYYITENCSTLSLMNCLYKEEYSFISFRLFPFVLFNFLMGVISYRYLSKLGNVLGKYTIYVAIFLILIVLIFSNLFNNPILISIFISIIFFTSLPSIWLAFKDYKYDKFFSNISYPIYIFSFISIYLSSFIIKTFQLEYNEIYFFFALLIDLIISFLYLKLFNYFIFNSNFSKI